MTNWLHGLNEKQLEAVTSPLGNSLVLAGAGSGKTRVLVSRIAWLMAQEQFHPGNILAVTFTNKAAGEMKERLNAIMHYNVNGLWVGTFHGLCNRLLRIHHDRLGLSREFQVVDSDDQSRMIKNIIQNLKLDLDKYPVPLIRNFINSQKDAAIRAQNPKVKDAAKDHNVVLIYEEYEKLCRSSGVVDFAELLLAGFELLRDNEDLAEEYRNKFRAVLVDEFQDTNFIQYEWIKILSGANTNVMVVGDDDQSIYGWRGAQVENIERFTQDFANVNIIRLEQNYRSTSTIIDAANYVIAENINRMGKTLWTNNPEGEKITIFTALNEISEAQYVAEQIIKAKNNGKELNDIAILYRSNAQSRLLEEYLIRYAIPYKIHAGVRFYERAEIKDALSYLRFLINTRDDTSLLRIINFPTRGIGLKTIEDIAELARANNLTLWDAVFEILKENVLPKRAHSALQKFVDLVIEMQHEMAYLTLSEQLRLIIEKTGLMDHFAKQKGDRGDSKVDNLKELINAARDFRVDEDLGVSNVINFLNFTSLEAHEKASGAASGPAVNLMTLHAAKGLEFPLVFIVGMEEGLFPSVKQFDVDRIEEERRLCYVGMTRAMQKLVLTHVYVRKLYGRSNRQLPSRFLRELPEELIEKTGQMSYESYGNY